MNLSRSCVSYVNRSTGGRPTQELARARQRDLKRPAPPLDSGGTGEGGQSGAHAL